MKAENKEEWELQSATLGLGKNLNSGQAYPVPRPRQVKGM